MTPENFIYWLQGKLEIGETKSLNEQEVQIIKDHIALVLKKETPKRELTIKDLQVPFIADPKMPPGEIRIIPQTATSNFCLGCGKTPCTGTGLGCRSLIATC
jgi:hypothetical protein